MVLLDIVVVSSARKMSSPSTVVHSDAPLGGVGEAGASAAMLLQGADGVETMEDWQHQEATSQSLPSAGIEPGTDPIVRLCLNPASI